MTLKVSTLRDRIMGLLSLLRIGREDINKSVELKEIKKHLKTYLKIIGAKCG